MDFTMSVVPTPLTFFEIGEELFLSDAKEFRRRYLAKLQNDLMPLKWFSPRANWFLW